MGTLASVTMGFFCYPGLFFVIPALSRDPERTAGLCKGRWLTLDPGSSPGMTKKKGWDDRCSEMIFLALI